VVIELTMVNAIHTSNFLLYDYFVKTSFAALKQQANQIEEPSESYPPFPASRYVHRPNWSSKYD